MEIYNYIFKVTNKWKRNRFGLRLYELLDELRLRGGINRFVHWKNRESIITEEEIQKNVAYWANKKDDIDRVIGMLNDEESKKVLCSMINYRCSGKYSDLPHSSFSTQYFINSFFTYNEGECFVDAGAFDGDTIIRFKRLMRKKRIRNYSIIAFEPDPCSYSKLKESNKDVVCINKGLYSSDAVLSFDSQNALTSSIVSNPDAIDRKKICSVEVTSIDNCRECRDATFIKMDIEGAEYEALVGAKNTIINNSPKLAICIYHSNDDMLRIIELVNSINPSYKLYVRQHTNALCETVLYAVV